MLPAADSPAARTAAVVAEGGGSWEEMEFEPRVLEAGLSMKKEKKETVEQEVFGPTYIILQPENRIGFCSQTTN